MCVHPGRGHAHSLTANAEQRRLRRHHTPHLDPRTASPLSKSHRHPPTLIFIHTWHPPSFDVSRRSSPPTGCQLSIAPTSLTPYKLPLQPEYPTRLVTAFIMAPKSAKTIPRSGSVSAATPVKAEPTTTADELAATHPSVIDDSSADTVTSTVDSLTGRKLAYPLPKNVSGTTINNAQSFLRIVILGLICAAAIGVRLFAVIRFESVIHEL